MPPPVPPNIQTLAMTVKELRDQHREKIRLVGLAMLGAPMTVMRWLR
jgi:hypothetical protein